MRSIQPPQPRGTALLMLIGLSLAIACYKDDGPAGSGGGPTRVLLTDAPFPFDSVQSVNIYIVRIEATRSTDTSGGAGSEPWEEIVAPHKAFDLLALQQGLTAVVGQGTLPAGQYLAVRMTINTDLSSIKWKNGTDAVVNWQNFTGTPEMPLYALIEAPMDVPPEGADIVIDFDLGRSFLYDFFGGKEFTFQHWLRAVNSGAAGAIAGTVTSDYSGSTQPIVNANVTVMQGDPNQSALTWYTLASGHTDASGRYRIGFLRPGTYIVSIQQPTLPFLLPVTTPGVVVTVGGTAAVSVSLPTAGGGGAYVQISGPTTVGVGGTIVLQVAVGDANGNPVPNPTVTWGTPDTGVVAIVDSQAAAFVTGRRSGSAMVVASSGGLSDTVLIQVVGGALPVDLVTVRPASATFTVGDSGGFYAELYDSAGTPLFNRTISWLVTDTTVLRIQPFGPSLLVRALKTGSATVRASSEGKSGQAAVTVQP